MLVGYLHCHSKNSCCAFFDLWTVKQIGSWAGTQLYNIKNLHVDKHLLLASSTSFFFVMVLLYDNVMLLLSKIGPCDASQQLSSKLSSSWNCYTDMLLCIIPGQQQIQPAGQVCCENIPNYLFMLSITQNTGWYTLLCIMIVFIKVSLHIPCGLSSKRMSPLLQAYQPMTEILYCIDSGWCLSCTQWMWNENQLHAFWLL